jgi:predicted acyltransferase (DUF342 family)
VKHPAHLILLTIALVVIAPSSLLHAFDGDRVQFGRSITIGQDEEVADVVCIGCSIRIDGTAADAVAIGGRITVNGTVTGDLVVVGGGASLGENAIVDGDVATVGGRLSRHSNSVVKGDITSHSGAPIFLGLVLMPLIPIVLVVLLVVWLIKPNRRQAPMRM